MLRTLKTVSLSCLLVGISPSLVRADSEAAYCEYYPKGKTQPEVAMACRYYQSMGHVGIFWADGVESHFMLQSNGVYRDDRGGTVYRELVSGAAANTIYRMPNGSIYIYRGENPGPTSAGLTPQDPLTLRGLGGVRIGMSVPEAQQIVGLSLQQTFQDYSCSYYKADGLDDVSFMVISGQIARIELYSDRFTTLSGAKVGDSKARILQLYPNNVSVTGKTMGRGDVLTYFPRDAADQNYRMIFETDRQGIIRTIRAGRLPEVDYVEGCV